MPVRNRTPADEQPLARPVREQPLARSVGGEPEETTPSEARQAKNEPTATRAEETRQVEKGPVTKAMDKAQENNWVYDAVANKAREKGWLDKADELVGKARNRLTGG